MPLQCCDIYVLSPVHFTEILACINCLYCKIGKIMTVQNSEPQHGSDSMKFVGSRVLVPAPETSRGNAIGMGLESRPWTS